MCRFRDGMTSTPRDAELTITRHRDVILAIDGVDARRSCLLADVRIPGRIADTPRHVYLPDGASCEIRDNDALDAALLGTERGEPSFGRRFERLRHRLESTWIGAAVALAVTASVLLGFTEWGAPAVARVVVALTPPAVESVIGENLIALLLQFDVLAPTELDVDRQDEILMAFLEMKNDTGVTASQLGFFSADGFGPNAFALPGGTVVLTDQLVELAQNDEEIVAVLAHELGHVAGRHVMRSLAQTSSMIVLWTVFTGDTTAAGLSILGPEQLLALRYSRDFEREADRFAFDYLLQNGIPPSRLSDLLLRIEGEHLGADLPNWLASHPGTRERARNADEAAGRTRSSAVTDD